MPSTSREIVKQAVLFQNPPRIPFEFPEKYGSDFVWTEMNPSPDLRAKHGQYDEWGSLWENIGVCNLGEVKVPVLANDFELSRLNIPNVTDPNRWKDFSGVRSRYPDKFLMASGLSIYERVHFIRGLENAWTDIHLHPKELQKLIDILVEMNLQAIEIYRREECDGYMFCDDWGLQNKLMIDPQKWREFWKPAYTRIYKAAHQAGMLTFLHSCGYIVDILDDLIESGLDVIQLDQQENMTLKLLHDRFAGRITFFCPVDIQTVMVKGSTDAIRKYCHDMVKLLGTPKGGFIARWYSDPVGAGHRQEAIDAMCEEIISFNPFTLYGK
jgi:hypothetical protein